jgi:hypothetical protein
MAVEIGLLFSAIEVGKSIAQFAGIIDSLETKIDRLIRSELNAALRALEQAAASVSEQQSLLRDARAGFNKAVTLETGHRRAVALLGLSLSHYWLGDGENSRRALDEILEINPVKTVDLAIAAGRGEFREFNPLTAWKLVATLRQEIRKNPGAVIGKSPIVRYGSLAFSGRARKEYYKRLVLDAVEASSDAKSIRLVQDSVSAYLGKPVPWLVALE